MSISSETVGPRPPERERRRNVLRAESDASFAQEHRLLIILDHELQLRDRAAPILATFTVRPPPLDAETRIRRVLRPGDCLSSSEGNRFSVMLVECLPADAVRVCRRIASALNAMAPEGGRTISVGLVAASREHPATTALSRSHVALEEASFALEKAGTFIGGDLLFRPLVVFATADLALFSIVHPMFAARGMALIPALDFATCRAFLQRTRPALVLSDVALPPNGGAMIWEELLLRRDPLAILVRRSDLQHHGSGSELVVDLREGKLALNEVLDLVLPERFPPIPALHTGEELALGARQLMRLARPEEMPLRPELQILEVQLR